jgi:hypothetical protein
MPSRQGEILGANIFEMIWFFTIVELGDHVVLVYASGEEVNL